MEQPPPLPLPPPLPKMAPVVNRAALNWARVGVAIWVFGCVTPAVGIKTWFWGDLEAVSLVSGVALLLTKNALLATIVALLGFGAPIAKWMGLFREAKGRAVHDLHAWIAKFSSLEIIAAAFLLVNVKIVTAGGDAFALPGLYLLTLAWICGVVSSFLSRKKARRT